MTINVWYDYFGPINEFIIPIQKILSQTRSLQKCLDFFEWYYKNSENYPENLVLKSFEFKAIEAVFTKQLSNNNFFKYLSESKFPLSAFSLKTLRAEKMIKDCLVWMETI